MNRLIAIFLSLLFSGSLFSKEVSPDSFLVYLTWQRDPSTTMTVQWVAKDRKESDDVFYQEEGSKRWQVSPGKKAFAPKNEFYFVHRVELTGLLPDKSYIFRLGSKDTLYKFRTLPDKLNKPIRFVAGGDMYHDDIQYLEETSKRAASTDPHFALIGGDIAYAVNKKLNRSKKEEISKWFRWIASWQTHMVTPTGHMIPMIPAIGNHDTLGFYNQPKENATSFYTFFAFPGPQGYNVLDFGSYLSLFVLDSGHTNPVAGEQTEWLLNTMEKRAKVPNKFALYHVPAYPSVRKYNKPSGSLIRDNWVPLFERFHLTAAFENHEHAYKRTHLIVNEEVNPNGVLYLGDGAWGVRKPRRPKKLESTWYLAKAMPERHFILVTLDGSKKTYQAMKPNGDVIDSFQH